MTQNLGGKLNPGWIGSNWRAAGTAEDTYSSSILREFVKGHLQREDYRSWVDVEFFDDFCVCVFFLRYGGLSWLTWWPNMQDIITYHYCMFATFYGGELLVKRITANLLLHNVFLQKSSRIALQEAGPWPVKMGSSKIHHLDTSSRSHDIFQDAVRFCLISMALHRGIVGDEARSYCQDLIGLLGCQMGFPKHGGFGGWIPSDWYLKS